MKTRLPKTRSIPKYILDAMSGIEWTLYTYNKWIGCTKVSEACRFCYAWLLAMQKKTRWTKGTWGPNGLRVRTATEPNIRRLNFWAGVLGIRIKVFTASLSDVFDDHHFIKPEWRAELWMLIRETPNIDWLILTKRPENFQRFLPEDWGTTGYANVWLGVTAENRQEFARRVPMLQAMPAQRRFLSIEPLLESLGTINLDKIDWVIVGGEAGERKDPIRKMDAAWAREVRDQVKALRKSFFFKQWGDYDQNGVRVGWRKAGNLLDGVLWQEWPDGFSRKVFIDRITAISRVADTDMRRPQDEAETTAEVIHATEA